MIRSRLHNKYTSWTHEVEADTMAKARAKARRWVSKEVDTFRVQDTKFTVVSDTFAFLDLITE